MTYVNITLAHFIFQKNKGGRGHKQISMNKTCYEIKKISTYLLSGEERVGSGVQILPKNKLKSEMFNNKKKLITFLSVITNNSN